MYVNSSFLYGPYTHRKHKHRKHRKNVLSIGRGQCFLQQTRTQRLWSVQSADQGDDNAHTGAGTAAPLPTGPGVLTVLTPITSTRPSSRHACKKFVEGMKQLKIWFPVLKNLLFKEKQGKLIFFTI